MAARHIMKLLQKRRSSNSFSKAKIILPADIARIDQGHSTSMELMCHIFFNPNERATVTIHSMESTHFKTKNPYQIPTHLDPHSCTKSLYHSINYTQVPNAKSSSCEETYLKHTWLRSVEVLHLNLHVRACYTLSLF